MSKRAAKFQLTAENFEQEEDANSNDENEGEFTKAPDDIICNRVIKKAKRRTAGTENSSSVFKGFTGLGSLQSPYGKPVFSSFSSNISNTESKTMPTVVTSASTEIPTFMQTPNVVDSIDKKSKTNGGTVGMFSGIMKSKGSSANGVLDHQGIRNKLNADVKEKQSNELNDEQDKDKIYVTQITELNLSVLSWVKQHVEENPLIDLTPVFNDYTKYMNEIESTHGKKARSTKDGSSTPSTVVTGSPVNSSASSTPISVNSKELKATGVSFKAPIAEFFSTAKTSTPAAPPSVGKDAENSDVEEENEEDEEKQSRKTIVEAEAFYTIRCKLFFKKGQEWKELGIGMLYLKPLDGKTQLLVRMETSGGNILLNILLHPKLPLNRVGKNNVSIVSTPNPPVYAKPDDGDNTKPVTYLIRVKGTEEADNLAKILTEKKGVE